MRMRVAKVFIAIVLLSAALFVAAPASRCAACSCGPASVQDAYGRSHDVFAGKALDIRETTDPYSNAVLGHRYAVLLDVQRLYKGAPDSQKIVFTALQEDSCGFSFTAGETYLVYANELPNGELVVSLCSRSNKLDEAAADVQQLGAGEMPGKRTDLSQTMKRLTGTSIGYVVERYAERVALKLAKPKPIHIVLSCWMVITAGLLYRRRTNAAGALTACCAFALWAVFAYYNPYATGHASGTVWQRTFWLLAAPAVLACFAAVLRSRALMWAAFAWSLPLSLYVGSTPGVFSWFLLFAAAYAACAALYRRPDNARVKS